MLKVRLIHWSETEAAARAERLRPFGYEVESGILKGPDGLKELRANPPAAVVIDLERIPSQGRDVGVALRSYKDTRRVPLVFIGGEPAKVERIKEILPDAVYTEWADIRQALEAAISRPPAHPVVPRSRMEAYSGAPLLKKLGVKPGTMVYLIDAPPRFEKRLGALPSGALLRRRSWTGRSLGFSSSGKSGRCRRLILWFVATRSDFDRRIRRMAALTPGGGMWIIWPKKSSGLRSGLTQNIVRAQGLSSGIVDYKVCAVDETWSGLLFARRKS